MKRFHFLLLVSSLSWLSTAIAQHPPGAFEPNVLGLPPVPQPKPGSSAAAATPGAKPVVNTGESAVSRNSISGEMSIQHGLQDGVGRLVYTSKAVFDTPARKTDAINTAKLVQAEFATKSCTKPCVAVKPAAPQILPDGRLQFELGLKPLYKHLDQNQYVAAMQGSPIKLRPEQFTAPVAAPITVVAPTPSSTTVTHTKATP